MFKFDEEKYYSMPPFFGGLHAHRKASFAACLSLTLRVHCDQKLLESYLPEGFELQAPEMEYTFAQCRESFEPQEEGLNFVMACLPVQYLGNDEGLNGLFPLVIWENNMASIVSVREDTGLPALFASIPECIRDRGCLAVSVGETGHPMLTLEFQEAEPLSGNEIHELNEEYPTRHFGWRYVPNIGSPGAALSQAAMRPFRRAVTSGWRGTGSVRWHPENFTIYPTQAHILTALASIPGQDNMTGDETEGSLHFMPELSRPLP